MFLLACWANYALLIFIPHFALVAFFPGFLRGGTFSPHARRCAGGVSVCAIRRTTARLRFHQAFRRANSSFAAHLDRGVFIAPCRGAALALKNNAGIGVFSAVVGVFSFSGDAHAFAVLSGALMRASALSDFLVHLAQPFRGRYLIRPVPDVPGLRKICYIQDLSFGDFREKVVRRTNFRYFYPYL